MWYATLFLPERSKSRISHVRVKAVTIISVWIVLCQQMIRVKYRQLQQLNYKCLLVIMAWTPTFLSDTRLSDCHNQERWYNHDFISQTELRTVHESTVQLASVSAMSDRPSDPDLSPLPVELLSLPHSNLYLRRMKCHDDDYEDIDELGPLPPSLGPNNDARVPKSNSVLKNKNNGYVYCLSSWNIMLGFNYVRKLQSQAL